MSDPPAPRPGKAPKAGKEPAAKEAKKQKALAAEVAALRADVDALKAMFRERGADLTVPPSAEMVALEEQMCAALTQPTDAAVLYACAYRAHGQAAVTGSHHATGTERIAQASGDAVARIGYAFASAAKVALVRSLILSGPQSAARLGEAAGLSTGSLYHHLRELVHSEIIHQIGRNQYALTPLGQQASLLLFALSDAAPRQPPRER